MKKILLFVALLVAVSALSLEFDINGIFQTGSNGLPRNWVRNGWTGYEPACTLEVCPNGGIQGNSLRMTNIQSPKGAAFNSTFYPGYSGDLLRLSFRARGKGRGKVQMYFKTISGEWNFMSPHSSSFVLSEEWREFSATLPVVNGAAGETGSFDIAFEMETGSDLEISDIVADLAEGKYRGDVPFPDKWTAFGPVDRDFIPDFWGMEGIPEELSGLQGKTYKRLNRTLDLGDLLPQEAQAAWLFAEVDSPIDCQYTIGAGADWWMQYYVNGELVIDTTETGNVEYPYDISNHVVDTRLRKGKNLLAVKLIRGSTSALLKLGGPQELTQRVLKLKISHMDWIEDFNGKEVTCGGFPELITGYPAPGLLTPTGQGLFRTAGTLRIDPAQFSLEAPDERDISRVIGVRLQDFGENETDGALSMIFQEGEEELRLEIVNNVQKNMLQMRVLQNGVLLNEKDYPKSALPADLLFGGDALGRYAVMATSLSGGDNAAFAGETTFFAEHATLMPFLEFQAEDGVITLDNFLLGQAKEKSPFSTAPFSVKPLPEFDPVKAGWKLVFDDEFDGDDIDWAKWKPGWAHCDGYHTVKDGILTIKADWTDDTHTKLGAASIKTREKYLYGYFEWRGRFKRQSGWWSAFWLYGETNTNAFYDGFEIDIYEDYYLASMEKGKPARNVLDHNLHMYFGGTLKSWNYNGPKLADPDAYTTIGCLWTPFEISYYMNGKLIESHAGHSPYDSVTFDAFNHGCGIVPLEVIVSSQVNRKSGGPASLGTFPDYFYTDYVRVYEYPHDNEPAIQWTAKPGKENAFCHRGDTLEFSVDAQPNPNTNSPIKCVYLFDSGSLLEYKTQPPYDFKVLLTKEFFDTTDYVKPGRQSLVPDFEENMHAFSAFVQDEEGHVAHTDAWMLYGIMEGDATDSTPYQGKAAAIPGAVELVKYDLGGEGVAYHDTTPENSFAKGGNGFRPDEGVDCGSTTIGYVQAGEWINYTVEIAESGDYAVDFCYGTPNTSLGKAFLMLDGFRVIGEFDLQCKPGEKADWGCTKHAQCQVELPAGKHIIRLFFLSGTNGEKLTFTRN